MADQHEDEGMTREEEFVMYFPVHYQDFRGMTYEQRCSHLLERVEAAADADIGVEMMEVAIDFLFGRRDQLEQLQTDNNVPPLARQAAVNILARFD